MDMEKRIEACARAAHEANRAYCLALGDESQPSWDDAPDWQKSSSRNGVQGALEGGTPEQSHVGWMAQKLSDGWIHGSVKDPSKKEHPCMVPYANLPQEQRRKDELFLSAVRSMAAVLGMVVTYPESLAVPAKDGLPALPAFPRRTIDYSKVT